MLRPSGWGQTPGWARDKRRIRVTRRGLSHPHGILRAVTARRSAAYRDVIAVRSHHYDAPPLNAAGRRPVCADGSGDLNSLMSSGLPRQPSGDPSHSLIARVGAGLRRFRPFAGPQSSGKVGKAFGRRSLIPDRSLALGRHPKPFTNPALDAREAAQPVTLSCYFPRPPTRSKRVAVSPASS